MKRSLFIYLILFTVFLVASLLSTFNRKSQSSIDEEARRIEKRLKALETGFEKFANDDQLIRSIIEREYTSKDIKIFSELDFDFLIYTSDSLVFWSDNLATPVYDIGTYNEGSSFNKLRNGWFELIVKRREDVTICGVIPVKSDYGIENTYLRNELNPDFQVYDRLDISPTFTQSGAVVYNIYKEPLFTITKSSIPVSKAGFLEQMFYWGCLIFICLCLHTLARIVVMKGKIFSGFSFLVLSFLLIRILIHFLQTPFSSSSIQLFSPAIYASGIFTKSLGDMLINAGLFLWIILFWFNNIKDELKVNSTTYRFSAYVILALLLFSIKSIIRSFVIDSNISFELDNFLELSAFSFVGLLIISMLLLSFWILSFGLIRQMGKESFGFRDLPMLIPAIVLTVLFEFLVTSATVVVLSTLTAICYILYIYLTHNYFKNISSIRAFSSLILLIFLFAFWAAIILEYFNHQKELSERKLYAIELSEERDLMTESLIKDIAPRIRSDDFIKAFFTNPYISKRDITERISFLYLRNISRKYDFTVYAFDSEGRPFKSTSNYHLSHFEEKINEDCDTIIDQNLYFIPEKSGRYAYYFEFPMRLSDNLKATLLIELTPKIFTTSNVYPELLLEERFRDPESGKYLYAIYAHGTLIAQKGGFPYDYFIDEEMRDIEEFEHVNTAQYGHLLHNPGKYKTIIVSLQRERWLKPLSVFSYLFCFFLFVSFIVSSLVLLKDYRINKQHRELPGLSFRNRITIAMILIIILSFLIIGFVTVRYFSNEYELYHKQRLIRKEKAVLSALEYLIKGQEPSDQNKGNAAFIKNELSVDIASLSDIHSMDINIFNLNGDLILSSKPEIFDKGLISGKMNPMAFYQLSTIHRNQYLHQEKIGLLEFLSVYVPVRNEEGEALAYLNLPYFAQTSNLREEISNFMVALVNVYVFLLVCAGFIAFFISNSITKPLKEISEKLRLLNPTKANEPIVWRRNDEIGKLVSEYNKMIQELEKNVQLLAKSERETAWREMAKQIAHEIKNPLTPMKLSIQYLQRSIETESAGKDELVERVSKTLIEQIDNLAEIASAFSSFAKMPGARNEVLHLEEITRSVFDLFKDNPGISYSFTTEVKEAKVFADKNQLISAFNNLMQNATQAIPDERQGVVEMKLYPDDRSYIVEISDNGRGIASHLQDKVFVPNFTTKSSGTGLGLAITRQIIENARGEIWFHSREHTGSSFYIKLPKYNDDQVK